jgi:hypothetical protein
MPPTHTITTKTTHKTHTAAQDMAHGNTKFFTIQKRSQYLRCTRAHSSSQHTHTHTHTYLVGMASAMHKLQIVELWITDPY